ncbi:GntR family transcriptional regulator [Cellulosimicrobium cellulans]|uniref:GntR family transcriptional regulator n=1 Tax=Cellulosimicrobium cellulans TaxID=1710 RepID=A0A1Y0HRR7_CELCE|nr:PLP-dependent aminotransferase family protein [Cellulosimicrobium cellulans]ARU50819.1 GntR family transcriptional regulator [Cellulosimicrobium cellulans]
MAVDQTNLRGAARPGTTAALAWEALLDLGTGPGSRVERLERAVRDAVHTGRVPIGAALPPSRQLAESLGVSRWVVTEAYGQLVSEGFLEARTGAATRVSAAAGARPTSPGGARSGGRPTNARQCEVPPLPGRARFDLAPGVPDLRHVPRDAWLRAAREALAASSNDDLGQPAPAGHPHARAVFADHLRRARVVAGPDDAVVLTRGATDGMARVAAALVEAGHTHLLVEDPSWSVLRDVAGRVGLTTVPVPVDHAGADVDALVAASRRTGARAALLTPAHQFPTGAALAPERREAVLAWARAVDGLVVEDDYDAEFRYDRRPVAALQQLDPDRVVLLGSVSKTMSPAFGVGWMVVPARWRESVMRAAATTHGTTAAPSTVDQLTFARLVASGGYDRHLRAARGRYRRRRDAVLDALSRELPGAAVRGIAAGMHALLTLPGSPDDPAPDAAHVVREAARREVTVVDLRRYQVRPADRSTTLVLGYGNLADARVGEAVARLADAVRAATRRGTGG